MKIWMLTGDKQETAENIGFACKLLTSNTTSFFSSLIKVDDMALIKINEKSVEETEDRLQHENLLLHTLQSVNVSFRFLHVSLPQPIALIIDGDTLNFALDDGPLSKKLLNLARVCVAVICCRCSPAQKVWLFPHLLLTLERRK